ncbi:response regulator [Spirosoma endophyticum]|uniref:CheY chemotaxis protein or a CheY-like REC (Receiver) domain n=1 Tax=Spirosoma endophyticum TaxID=662367 RepID=A0A1I1U118_9BACT|nr:response regulator [Spirosoma endophyticum]SFD63298.1 CheY chemotaxis protein or a CheY-like REC (receiver) domain [Spirosoma endophyticum]
MPARVPAVWFVDDDEDDRLFVRSAFEDIGPAVTVLTLNNGEQLLAELKDSGGLPKLILLDLNMPGLNGFELLRQLRSTPSFTQIPVVIFTTSSNELDRQKSLTAGANGFLTKPTTYDDLSRMAQSLSQQWVLTATA